MEFLEISQCPFCSGMVPHATWPESRQQYNVIIIPVTPIRSLITAILSLYHLQRVIVLFGCFPESSCNQLPARMLHLPQQGLSLRPMERTMTGNLGTGFGMHCLSNFETVNEKGVIY